ncbi:hypothetical protein BDM02DRAFT_3125522 [Thelephora ganbajun]|uniref:Uncharacterized protein n=1 Tax=Thelephora ganbajun TaxID=370292 RepID=A0ACB6ZVV9_THEGA|nr:hypothetical protein BDM02DRAFT_3125522 [Thelephora ganbajun]
MRSFTLSIFATLAFAVFSYAAPMFAGPSPVDAIAARHEGEHTKDTSLEVVLTTAIELITPITAELGCIKAENATVEVIAPIVAKLKIAIGDVICDVKALASLPLERILCTLVGGVLDAVAIAKLLACLLNLVFGACASILAVVAVSVKAQIIPILVEVGCLVGSLLCAVLGLANGLIFDIIKCLLPQIVGCLEVIKMLDIRIIIAVLRL